MKELAERCSFVNPTRCTGQGKRAEGCSRLVNSKECIPMAETMRAARHSSAEQHLSYVEPDEEAHAKRYRAMASKTVEHVSILLFLCERRIFPLSNAIIYCLV